MDLFPLPSPLYRTLSLAFLSGYIDRITFSFCLLFSVLALPSLLFFLSFSPCVVNPLFEKAQKVL